MLIKLTPTYNLSNECVNAEFGQILLVRNDTGKRFLPNDPIHAYPTWKTTSAAEATWRMVQARYQRQEFTPGEQAMLDFFLKSGGVDLK